MIRDDRKRRNQISYLPPGNYPQELLSKISSLKTLDEASLKANIQPSLENIICLVADIRGFTDLMEHNPNDVVALFLTKFLDRCGDFISDAGGQINKYLGDGLLANFPMEKLILCMDTAFEMHNYFENLLKKFNFPEKKPIGLSVAITSGLTIKGIIGSSAYRDYTLLGRHINQAFRLVKEARWGQTWSTNELKNQLSNKFLYIQLREVDLKGVGAVTPIWVFRKRTPFEIDRGRVSTCSICSLCNRHEICDISFNKGMIITNLNIDCHQCNNNSVPKHCMNYEYCLTNHLRGKKEDELGLEPLKLGRACCETCQFFATCFYSFFQAKKILVEKNPGPAIRLCCDYCDNVNGNILCKNLSLN